MIMHTIIPLQDVLASDETMTNHGYSTNIQYDGRKHHVFFSTRPHDYLFFNNV